MNSVYWKLQYRKIIKTEEKTEAIRILPIEGNSLFLVPHADDELLSSYCTINNLSSEIALYYFGFVGSNSNKENIKRRYDEFISFCKLVQVQYIIADDGFNNLGNIVRNKEIRRAFLPSLVDWHYEHRKTNYLFLEQCEKEGSRPDIFWYQVTVPIVNNRCKIVLPIEPDEQEKKYRVFKRIYRSQRHMPLLRFELNERISGHKYGYFACEVFMHLGYSEWKEIAESFFRCESDKSSVLYTRLDELRDYIDDIGVLRRKSEEIYDMIFREKAIS